mmetsp:Transcript_34792/g.69336  ORF Transcript_34792/g.69336 Transcript_34792/m.69336 type:complete len:241 (+) Transcript_34792:567-1289(+)
MGAAPDLRAAALHAAAAVGPSMMRARGRAKAKDMTVRTPKRFSGVMFSPLGLSMERREKMLRVAKARLESIAPPKASQVKESSLTEARATPATMGMRESAVRVETEEPRMRADSPQVKTGSAALTICVNETAPAPADTTAPMCPMAWQKAMGSSVLMASAESLGGLRMPVSQSGMTNAVPTKSEKALCVHGSGSKFRRTLFWMLYPVDRANQSAKYRPTLSMRKRPTSPTISQPSVSQSA